MPASSAVERAVSGWLNHLEVERGVAANTLSSYRRDLTRYTAYLEAAGVRDPEEIRESHVAGFLASLREGGPEHRPLAASSAARTLVAVRGFHRFLALEGDVQTDPAGAVSPPRAPASPFASATHQPRISFERTLAKVFMGMPMRTAINSSSLGSEPQGS